MHLQAFIKSQVSAVCPRIWLRSAPACSHARPDSAPRAWPGRYTITYADGTMTVEAKALTITASDTSGASQEVTRPVDFAPIRIDLSAPQPESVVSPSLHVVGTCHQADGPCPSIFVRVEDVAEIPLTNVTAFDVPFALEDGWPYDVSIYATDGNLRVFVRRYVTAETSTHITPYAHVNGEVLEEGDRGFRPHAREGEPQEDQGEPGQEGEPEGTQHATPGGGGHRRRSICRHAAPS